MRFIKLILMVIIINGCSNDSVSVNFSIEGASNAVIVRIDGEHTVPWDTVKIINNELKLDLPLDSTLMTFYYFIFDSGASLRIGVEPGDKLIGSVNASGSLTDYEITGSELSEQLLALYQPVLESSRVIDSLDEYRKISNDPDSNYILIETRHYKFLENRYHNHKKEILKVMAMDSSNLSNVFGFFQKVAAAPIFSSKEEDHIFFQEFGDVIIEKHPNHPLARIFILERKRMLGQ